MCVFSQNENVPQRSSEVSSVPDHRPQEERVSNPSSVIIRLSIQVTLFMVLDFGMMRLLRVICSLYCSAKVS
jgi:hypothetical protein